MPTQEDSTTRFLKTNGPSPGAFEPSSEAKQLANGTCDSEALKFLILSSSTHGKQNEWLINEVIGLKGAHRVIHQRLENGDIRFKSIEDKAAAEIATHTREDAEQFSKINATLAIFTDLHSKWLDRKRVRRAVYIGIGSAFLLPLLAGVAIDVVKHIFGW